jgi:hypothetical protein
VAPSTEAGAPLGRIGVAMSGGGHRPANLGSSEPSWAMFPRLTQSLALWRCWFVAIEALVNIG